MKDEDIEEGVLREENRERFIGVRHMREYIERGMGENGRERYKEG